MITPKATGKLEISDIKPMMTGPTKKPAMA